MRLSRLLSFPGIVVLPLAAAAFLDEASVELPAARACCLELPEPALLLLTAACVSWVPAATVVAGGPPFETARTGVVGTREPGHRSARVPALARRKGARAKGHRAEGVDP